MHQCAQRGTCHFRVTMPKDEKTMLSPLNQSQPAANLAEMAGRAGLRTVAAAWPTGIAHLGFAVTACERCAAAEVCSDWLARAPKTLGDVPPFCPNAGELRSAKRRD
jgi:hypothetical protein